MNALASKGISGLLYAVAPGIVLGSDVANLALLGITLTGFIREGVVLRLLALG